MTSNDSQVVLLYYVNYTNKEDTIKEISQALSSHAKVPANAVSLQKKDDKWSAYISLPQSEAQKLLQIKSLNISGQPVQVRRYFSDFQIFINKLPDKLEKGQVANYFSKFGKVDDVQITQVHHQENDPSKTPNRHCYVKFRNEQDIDKCISEPRHVIQKKEMRVVRTYKIGQNQDTDKKIFIKITPNVHDVQNMENLLNNEFSKFGKLRERIRVEPIGQTNSSKTIVTYINDKSCQSALQNFQSKTIENHKLELRPFIPKENNSYRLFVSGLKPNVSESDLEAAFSAFGKVTERTVISSKKVQANNGIVGFDNESSMKKALVEFKDYKEVGELFAGLPFITIHMSAKERKQMDEFNKRNTNPKKNLMQSNSWGNPNGMHYNMNLMNYNQNLNVGNMGGMGMGGMNMNMGGMGMGGMNMNMGGMGMNMGGMNMNMGGMGMSGMNTNPNSMNPNSMNSNSMNSNSMNSNSTNMGGMNRQGPNIPSMSTTNNKF